MRIGKTLSYLRCQLVAADGSLSANSCSSSSSFSMSEDSQKPSSDVSLLNRFRSGDEDAALQLYYRYSEKLLKLASRETPQDLATRFDPEDIVQSVFRTFFRRAATGQYEAPEGDELWKLLLVMALNKVRGRAAHHRAGKRDVRKTQSLSSDSSTPISESCDEVARNVLCMSVEEVIDKQPESHRNIIRLRIDGYDVRKIAEREKRSKRTVERILQSFRSELIHSALISIGEVTS